MLSEERYSMILDLLHEKGNVTLQDLVEKLNTSESTVRRDLQALENTGYLQRVHGGAVLKNSAVLNQEDRVSEKRSHNPEQKRRIGQKAAELIEPGDMVYIDAGTTTEAMLGFIDQKEARYVTNAITHAKYLADKGFHVCIPGGQFKALTEAIVGMEAAEFLERYNFTKGFFGTNGIGLDGRLTTVEVNEAMTKKKAMSRCRQCYVLADSSKFNGVSPITFGNLEDARLITDQECRFEIGPEKEEADIILA